MEEARVHVEYSLVCNVCKSKGTGMTMCKHKSGLLPSVRPSVRPSVLPSESSLLPTRCTTESHEEDDSCERESGGF